MFNLIEDLSARGRYKASSNARGVDEILAAIEANNDGVETQIAGHVAAYDELLAKIDAVLRPCPGPLSWLIIAIGAFSATGL